MNRWSKDYLKDCYNMDDTKSAPQQTLEDVSNTLRRQAEILAHINAQITAIEALVAEAIKSPYHHYQTVRDIYKILNGENL